MTEVTAILVTVQGEVSMIDLAEKGDILQGMYEALDCRSVDRVALAYSVDMWVDDEGLLTYTDENADEVLNPFARAIVAKYLAYSVEEIQIFCGNVLIARKNDEGDTISVSPAEVDIVTKIVNKMK